MPAMRDSKGRFTSMADGLANLVTGAGTSADKRTYAFYTQPYILPQQIEAAYRSSWMMKKGINLPAKDMTRKRRSWQADEDSVDLIEAEEKRIGLWKKLREAIILGRLGGGLLLMGVGTEDPSTQLDPSMARDKGALKFLHVMNRWQVSLGQRVMDPLNDLFGQPEYFQINYGAGGRGQVKVHPSRVIAFRGEPTPNLHGMAGDNWFWGDPLILSVQDAVKNAESAMNGFASLIDEAKVDTVTIPGLTQMVSTTEGEAMVRKRVSIANRMKSIHNTRILDGGRGKDSPGEEWDTRQINWAGIPDMIRVKAAIVASAFDIPATRFLGKAPDGMNATGEGDEANYAVKIATDQDDVLRPALDQLDVVLLPSAGVTLTDEANYDFPPLKEMSELDRATIFDRTMDAVTKLQATGSIPGIAFDKAMQHTAVENGYLDGLDGALAEVPEAERFPSDLAEEMPVPGDPGLSGAEAVLGVPTRRAANDVRFMDATPRTLYVQRKLLNTDEFIKWAKGQGFESTTPADEIHVTITFSRQPIDWMKMGSTWEGNNDGGLTVQPGGARIVEALGDKGAVVLLFSSSSLSWRHEEMVRAGASFDFSEYQPHVTITYAKPDGLDLGKVKPYQGKLVFGPELFSEVVDNWEQTVEES